MKKPTTAIEMIRSYLKQYGYDGLYCPNGDCGCKVGDLIPCSTFDPEECSAGYLTKAEGIRWGIGPEKEVYE